ncbi:MAG: response regulator [Candidatus Omnitrophica bacterium]|nr:response regulator [Candidatus Omnitrophota bacterium]MBU1924879.1 response regulator [Candidatus Omnitrophota bacterium]
MNSGKKILIVDDEPDILRAVIFRLKKAGYFVIEARDGKTGLETAQRERPDLILLDVQLPLIDGLEACKQLKALADFQNTPIMFFSASTDALIEEEIKKIGGCGYLRKPFEAQELLLKVEQLLKQEREKIP